MNRRDFLALCSLGALAPLSLYSALAHAAPQTGRRLILVELKGGNDGLNTLVPWRDPAYQQLRPTLALPASSLLPLADNLAFHHALEPLLDSWTRGELAVLQGVGYPRPNFSHFRSIEIWDSASDSEQVLDTGWLGRAIPANLFRQYSNDAILLGSASPGPLSGNHRIIALKNAQQFSRQARLLDAHDKPASNSALAHILDTENHVVTSAQQLKTAQSNGQTFGSGEFAQQCELLTSLIQGGNNAPVYKLSLGSFDTHSNQLPVHERLLAQLAGGLAGLSSALRQSGHWKDTLVMTYSEFGRRAAENGSRGTDHGTASVHFALGGSVHGGLYGRQPSLTDLEQSNLRQHLDFRSLYATVLERWWQIPAVPSLGKRFPLTPFV